MTHHVIVGAGPVGTNAIETIRQYDEDSQITLICDEPAHSRMALPYWLSGQFPKKHTFTADEDYLKNLNVDAKLGTRVQSVDPPNNTIATSDGETISYDNLLIATGSRPRVLSISGADLPGVQSLWSLEDTGKLIGDLEKKSNPHVAMIGAGFIGCIMLNAMHKRGWKLTVLERESHILPQMLDSDSAAMVEHWLGQKGVAVSCGATVQEIQLPETDRYVVKLEDGSEVEADALIIATGVQANVEFLDGSGIEIDQGILVNEFLQTNFPNIFAGGDVAQGPNLLGGSNEIHAIQPTAVDHGRIAGANMAGEQIVYPGSLSMNILDVCGLQNASFGNWNAASAEATTICNPDHHIYRQLLWTGDEITGAILVGEASNLGMLQDLGMIKGIIQTRTKLGQWKTYLQENPFDVRKPFVGCNVAAKLTQTTLLGRPAKPRDYRFGNPKVETPKTPSHSLFMNTK